MKSFALLLSLLLTLAGAPVQAADEGAPATDRRHEIDLRIKALDAERAEISTTGPKAATFVGLGLLAGGGISFGAGLASDCINSNECKPPSGAIIAGITLMGVGAIASITGGIIWGMRADRRNALDVERDSLIEEREGITAALSRLELRSPHRDGTQFVTLGFRF